MSDLTTSANVLAAFYRLTGTKSADTALIEHDEAVDQVAYEYLTRGVRRAQRFMLTVGFHGWRQRSPALTFTGSDATTGGVSFDLTTLDPLFLRVYGESKPGRSALLEADGTRWGTQIEPEEDQSRGDRYYILGDELWLTRKASPPSPLYLDYHFRHDEWASNVTIDFPLEARHLIVAEGAYVAMHDNWLPAGAEMEAKITRAWRAAREEARDISRPTKSPRKIKKAPRFGTRY